MCLFQVQHKPTSLYIPFYCFKGSFDRSLNVPVSPGCLVQRIFEDCICVSLFSYQGSQCLLSFTTACLIYHSRITLSTTFFNFFIFFFLPYAIRNIVSKKAACLKQLRRIGPETDSPAFCLHQQIETRSSGAEAAHPVLFVTDGVLFMQLLLLSTDFSSSLHPLP